MSDTQQILAALAVDIGIIKTKVCYLEQQHTALVAQLEAQRIHAIDNKHYWITTFIALAGAATAAVALWT